MSATICPINPPGHDWQNGLACRWCDATRTPEEAILSQLASRRGGNDTAARALLDAYTARKLADLGEQYPGELAALRGFTRALRPAARYGDLAEVQKLIAAHAAQEAAARQDTATPATGGTR
jgi:hypothetical protein